jgi:hypothetical protein
LAGLKHEELKVTTDSDRDDHSLSIHQALGLTYHPFVWNDPHFCATFAKCVRGRGGDLELSGESFNELVLPILTAVEHFRKTEAPPKTAQYCDLHLTIGVGILNAPMMAVSANQDPIEITYQPWFRIVRHEAHEDPEWWRRNRLFAVDIVHKDFFQTYAESHVLPFAKEVATRGLRHQIELVSGKGFVPKVFDHFPDVEGWLRPSRYQRAPTNKIKNSQLG